ncbi:hypothetical protein AYO21_06460 [Fonsecaea monophora]|uniref:Galactose oxidase-like Early set domain-containing protein n=1 Tax=Fonsecaea monophora TaxID=254056 RepID=A0A177F5Y1_9EURO|nr:hypothetical protein AYO21_06460 [Fonsecaea monophora]OAG39256.1 hypothetical protein AYO21_06460 [Fonsecaea monophora]
MDIGSSYLSVIARSGVPVMHAAVLPPSGKVLFLDKVEDYSELRLPNNRWAYSALYDPETHHLSPLSVATNPFCCGGSFLSDGRLVTVGGNAPLLWLDPTVGDGFDAIRYIGDEGGNYSWKEPGNKLASNRWYATAQTLADGKIFVAAGSLNGQNQFNFSNNNPTYEILDVNGMYPFLHLMPDGSLFIFADTCSELFDVAKNETIRTMPDLPGMHRTYPNTGGSVMLPLRAENNYEAEIMICGGGQTQAINSPCEATCGRLKPMGKRPLWEMSTMPGPRGMVEGVLLLDGTVLWINGCHKGAQGFGLATYPALELLVYDPKWNNWTVSGRTTIARLYHSVAFLLLDGTVLIAGSNPNEMPVTQQHVDIHNQYKAFPTEFRMETWIPPYLRGDKASRRPTVMRLSTYILRRGKRVTIEFSTVEQVKTLDIVLYSGGFITHSVHMGQVMVYLENNGWETLSNGRKRVVACMPEQVKLAPGPYVVYLLANGIPAVGKFVTVRV